MAASYSLPCRSVLVCYVISLSLLSLCCELRFHALYDIRTDWRLEDIGQGVRVLSSSAIRAVDRDCRSARHLGCCCDDVPISFTLKVHGVEFRRLGLVCVGNLGERLGNLDD